MVIFKVNILVGFIWNNDDVKEKVLKVVVVYQGIWIGQWNIVVELEMSVVEVEFNVKNFGKNEFKINVFVGLFWSNDEVQKIGLVIVVFYGVEFIGQWRIIVEGVMSVIEIKYMF